MRRQATALAIAAALPAGCGGDPSPERQRAALHGWAGAADRACTRSVEEVQRDARAGAADALMETAAGAAEGAARAVQAIRGRDVPEDGRRLAQPVRSDLERLAGELERISRDIAAEDRNAAEQRMDDVRTSVQEWEPRATAAGMKACLSPKHVEGLLDAVRGPLFVADFADLHAEIEARLGRVVGGAPASLAEMTTLMQAIHPVLDDATGRMGATNPPAAVTEEAQRYTIAMEVLTEEVDEYLYAVEEGMAAAALETRLRDIRRAAARWGPRGRDLRRALERITAVPEPGERA